MKIGDICDINAASISKKDRIEKIKYLDTSNITENRIESLRSYNILDAPSRAQRKVKNNTILYSLVRPNLRHFGKLTNPESNLIVSTGFATLDVKEEFSREIDADYLYYSLTQQYITNHLQTIAENSVSSYPSISTNDLASIDISFPSYDVQKRISQVLLNIDKKISINKQINRNLAA